jgi:signal transduction histidine kinase
MNVFKSAGNSILGLPSVPQETWTLNKITLKFTGNLSRYENDYLDDYFQRTLNPFRFSLVLSLLFYGAFAFLDAVTVPSLKEVFWFIRFGMIFPALIAVFAFTYSRYFKKMMQVTIAGIMFITGLGIIIMIVYAARFANDYSYYAGLILIFIFGYTFVRARFVYASIAGWSIVIAYEISAIWLSNTPLPVLVSNNYFFISANIIGMFISYFLELSSRKDFYMRKLLEMEQEKVKEANNALENRVKERTTQLTNSNLELINEIEIRKKTEKERAELEKQLFQLQKMETIGTLAGGIAHDFNNILTPILGYTDMALEELPPESTLKFDLEQINTSALRGKDLVQKILTFSREVDFEKKPIKMKSVINEVLNMLMASLPDGIEVKFKASSATGTVLADATHLHQIIMNLCTNAVHAMKDQGGILELSLKAMAITGKMAKEIPNLKKGKYIILTISDTGHGMDSVTRKRIFEPFFTKKEVGSGSGLGLSVVHGIVNNYDGAITVESEPGTGTIFTLYLPEYEDDGLESSVASRKVAKGDEYILFVDDEQEITFMGKRMLENLGYKVTVMTDSLAALDEFSSNPNLYSLLVTDQTMPRMLGTELAARVKKIKPEIKIIIITGFVDNLTNEMITEIGISELVIKPLVFSDFSKTIRRVLDL